MQMMYLIDQSEQEERITVGSPAQAHNVITKCVTDLLQ